MPFTESPGGNENDFSFSTTPPENQYLPLTSPEPEDDDNVSVYTMALQDDPVVVTPLPEVAPLNVNTPVLANTILETNELIELTFKFLEQGDATSARVLINPVLPFRNSVEELYKAAEEQWQRGNDLVDSEDEYLLAGAVSDICGDLAQKAAALSSQQLLNELKIALDLAVAGLMQKFSEHLKWRYGAFSKTALSDWSVNPESGKIVREQYLRAEILKRLWHITPHFEGSTYSGVYAAALLKEWKKIFYEDSGAAKALYMKLKKEHVDNIQAESNRHKAKIKTWVGPYNEALLHASIPHEAISADGRTFLLAALQAENPPLDFIRDVLLFFPGASVIGHRDRPYTPIQAVLDLPADHPARDSLLALFVDAVYRDKTNSLRPERRVVLAEPKIAEPIKFAQIVLGIGLQYRGKEGKRGLLQPLINLNELVLKERASTKQHQREADELVRHAREALLKNDMRPLLSYVEGITNSFLTISTLTSPLRDAVKRYKTFLNKNPDATGSPADALVLISGNKSYQGALDSMAAVSRENSELKGALGVARRELILANERAQREAAEAAEAKAETVEAKAQTVELKAALVQAEDKIEKMSTVLESLTTSMVTTRQENQKLTAENEMLKQKLQRYEAAQLSADPAAVASSSTRPGYEEIRRKSSDARRTSNDSDSGNSSNSPQQDISTGLSGAFSNMTRKLFGSN